MADIEVFLQGAGVSRVVLVKVPADGHVKDLVEVAKQHGLNASEHEGPRVWLENVDEPLDSDAGIDAAGIKSRSRVQVHMCHRIAVAINFQTKTKSHPFAPSATIAVVKAWAVEKFELSAVDATEYALQVCNSTERPSEDTQLGSLTSSPQCAVCFDLVPKQRVEG